MTVNVVGLGYIGLPTALIMAGNGVKVIGTDVNASVVEQLKMGRLTFEETGLDELLKKAIAAGIEFASKPSRADIYIIAVPTPYNDKDKKIDLTYLKNALLDILGVCEKGCIIAIESTISPGVIHRQIYPAVREKGYVCEKDIHIAYVPERIIPGNMIYELINNSRTIGAASEDIGVKLAGLYGAFCKGEMITTSIQVAEMTKVVENTYRDINIAFANELAKMCNVEGVNVHDVIKIANMHPRVNILSPGPGVGGHCISVDPWFLVGDYPTLAELVFTARRVNDYQPIYVLSRIREIMRENGISSMSDVGFYGLTYKENVDDTRRSPALQILEYLDSFFVTDVKSFDPMLKNTIVSNQYDDFDKFLTNIKMLVVLVAHDHIVANQDKVRDKVVYDTRSCLGVGDVYKL